MDFAAKHNIITMDKRIDKSLCHSSFRDVYKRQVTECVYQALVDYNQVGNVDVVGFYYSDVILAVSYTHLYRYQSPNKLSGGQKQRVAIAGVVAMRPSCIVLDEPTAMLDPNGRKEVLKAVSELNKKEKMCIRDRLRNGQCQCIGPDILPENIKEEDRKSVV